MLTEYFSGIWQDRFVLINLVNNDLKMKYRHSLIGVAWAVLTPLGLVLIIGCVYSVIFNTDPRVFIPTLFAGLNPWLFISGSADGGTAAFIAAEGYLKQTTVHAQIFPLRVVLVNFINLCYSLIAFFIVYVFLQPQMFNFNMLLLFPGLFIGVLFTLSISNIAAVINLNIRDYQPLQSLILQGLFYATPIIYLPSMLAEKGFALVYLSNPIYYIMEIIRAPMLGQPALSVFVYSVAIGLTLLLFLVSVHVVIKAKHNGIAFKL